MEEYRTVENFPLYEVSSMGNVRNKKTHTVLKGGPCQGYIYVTLVNDSGRKSFRVHRLVAMAFIDNPLNKPIVDHKNNNRSDNRVENLRWVTSAENGVNTKMYKNNTSGYKGIYYDETFQKWVVRICRGGRCVYFDMFDSAEEAVVGRIDKLKEISGDEYINEGELILYQKFKHQVISEG